MQINHMPRPHRLGVGKIRTLRKQRPGHRLRGRRAGPTLRGQAKDVVVGARDHKHRARIRGRQLQPPGNGQKLADADDVFVIVIPEENALVEGARRAPQVGAPAEFGGRDEVARVEAGEAGGVEEGGEEDGLREPEGDGDDADAEAGEDEGGDVGGVVGGHVVAEDGAVGVADEDDFAEGAVGDGGAGFELQHELVQDGFFELDLLLEDGVRVGGVAVADAVDGQGGVALRGGVRDPGVHVAVVADGVAQAGPVEFVFCDAVH